jgi:hypothetical protein
MSRTRNVRDRGLRRWELREIAVWRRNGVQRDGCDPRNSHVTPYCVLAYTARGPGDPLTTRHLRNAEFRIASGERRRVIRPSTVSS